MKQSCIFLLIIALYGVGCGTDGEADIDAGADDTGGDADTDSDTDADTDTDSDTDSDSDTATDGETDTDTASDSETDSESETDIDTESIPLSVPTVEIQIDPAAIDAFDQNPYEHDDVKGVFIDGDGTRYEDVDLSYRGAWKLGSMINSGIKQRNWKVKFPKIQKYQNRREWNYNYQRHMRETLAYDLMRFAGVPVPNAHHVLFVVNGDPHGLYIEYEDPDSKDWLEDHFGDDSGDLYKCGFDQPHKPPSWAKTDFLGDNDEDYYPNYRKQTNKSGEQLNDYHTIREFLTGLNQVADADLGTWFDAHFDVAGFINYLVVSNFISNWDSQPQRPKNFWLYQHPVSQKFVFVPWDLDNTFGPDTFPVNPMGTTASIFYQLDDYEEYTGQSTEGTERPLVRRMIKHKPFRDAYIARYQEAATTIFDKDFLLDRADRMRLLVQQYATSEDFAEFERNFQKLTDFITRRCDNIQQQLAEL